MNCKFVKTNSPNSSLTNLKFVKEILTNFESVKSDLTISKFVRQNSVIFLFYHNILIKTLQVQDDSVIKTKF